MNILFRSLRAKHGKFCMENNQLLTKALVK
jgi:hypothetical protein